MKDEDEVGNIGITRIAIIIILLNLLLAVPSTASSQQLLLARDTKVIGDDYKGIVDLTVRPGVENAKVSINVDGQQIADSLRAPYRVIVDFGPAAVQHKISVTVIAPNGRRVQWHETINQGHLPLGLKVRAVDLATRLFEAQATAPIDDPIATVDLWEDAKIVATKTEPPYRFTISEASVLAGFVQVTAKTKSGEEVADFWSSAGEVHTESIQVRTVPIFVSVVDQHGAALDNIDRSLFRILDNDSETKIVEFGKAFDQPISIALLVDSSASMTETMSSVAKAANEFAQRTLKPGDRCSVTAIQEVPRRRLTLSEDAEQVKNALQSLKPSGQTALYDAISSAVRELKDEKRRRAIVVLTDGADTSSIASSEDIDGVLREAGIPLYAIAYESGMDGRNLDLLKYLTGQTGGFVAVATQQNLQAKYHEIEKDLRAQFAIQYQVTDYAKPNEWRRVRVTLNSPKLTARTIRGYFTP
jgi:VWFA-related protein